MSRAVAIGSRALVAGYALAGVQVVEADSPAAVLAAWEELTEDVSLVILTPAARAALESRLEERPGLLWTQLPG